LQNWKVRLSSFSKKWMTKLKNSMKLRCKYGTA
jgi:hypothetical protein